MINKSNSRMRFIVHTHIVRSVFARLLADYSRLTRS